MRELGEHQAARDLEEDVLSRRRRLLYEEHREMTDAVDNLAATLRAQGDYPALKTLLEDVLSRRRDILGDDHRHTISIRKALDDL